uniref:Tapasin long form n=1 Tax=Callorhinchus milii TaxID=7868 RepID=V9KRF2_CALMI
MREIGIIFQLSVLLGLSSATVPGLPPSPGDVLVDCWYIEEGGGQRGSFPKAVTQEKSQLHLRRVSHKPGAEQDIPERVSPNADLKPGMLFDVTDYWNVICDPGFRRLELAAPKPHCEINNYVPQDSHVLWAQGLTQDQKTPAYASGSWFSSDIQAADGNLRVASVHRLVSAPGEPGTAPRKTSVVLNVFTRSALVRTRLGGDVLLDCGFTMDRQTGFGVEWRYQYKGSGHLVYAYHGPRDQVHVARDGTEMLFYALHSQGNASLLIRNVTLEHEGTYICTVYTPNLHTQQSIDLEIAEPPKVTLSPDPLYAVPGGEERLSCEITRYYPLDVSVRWVRAMPGVANSSQEVRRSWQSGHHQNPDGTYSISSYIQIQPQASDHGAVYTCTVQHVSVTQHVRKSITLRVAGAAGPSIEDIMGLLICAFVLYGVLRLIFWIYNKSVYPLIFGSVQQEKEKRN